MTTEVRAHLHKLLDKAIAAADRGAYAESSIELATIIGACDVTDILDQNCTGLVDIAVNGRLLVAA